MAQIKLRPGDVEIIFGGSVANGATYREPTDTHYIPFPRGTWFQRRLEMLREQRKDSPEENESDLEWRRK